MEKDNEEVEASNVVDLVQYKECKEAQKKEEERAVILKSILAHAEKLKL